MDNRYGGTEGFLIHPQDYRLRNVEEEGRRQTPPANRSGAEIPWVVQNTNLMLAEIIERVAAELGTRDFNLVISSVSRSLAEQERLSKNVNVASAKKGESSHLRGLTLDFYMVSANRMANDALIRVLRALKSEGKINLVFEYKGKVAHVAVNPFNEADSDNPADRSCLQCRHRLLFRLLRLSEQWSAGLGQSSQADGQFPASPSVNPATAIDLGRPTSVTDKCYQWLHTGVAPLS